MPGLVSKWSRLKRVLPPVTFISLAGMAGAVAGIFVLPISFGILRLFTSGWGFILGLFLGVMVARRIWKE